MIFAVVITYNPDIFILEQEYRSIVSQVDGIVYIDNFSINRNRLKDWSENKNKTSFVWLNDNEGIGVAQNVGIKKALNEGANHIIIFDQDTIIDDDFVKSLISAEKKALEDGINVGLTGPVYRSHDNNFEYPILTLRDGRLVKIPSNEIGDYFQITHMISSGSLIRREVIDIIGFLREDYFLGYIDFEYCFRALQNGFTNIITKNACMRHNIGDKQILLCGRKIGLYSPFRRYFDCRNTLLIQRDNIFPKAIRKHYLKLLFGKCLISLIYGPSRIKQVLYCSKGFLDGLKGKRGKCTLR